MHKIIAAAVAVMLLTGCRSVRETIEVPVYVHDTVYQKMVQYDSVYIDRWHTVEAKGDTIFVTNEVTKTKIVTKTDTAYRYIERPVTVSKTETVEVKKPLVWWQKTLMYAGGALLLTLLCSLVVWGIKHRSRLLP